MGYQVHNHGMKHDFTNRPMPQCMQILYLDTINFLDDPA